MYPEVYRFSLFTQYDIYLFRKGQHRKVYKFLGSKLMTFQEMKGCYFAVWAPNAKSVSVIGDFNLWQHGQLPLFRRSDGSGIWEGFISGIKKGSSYKYNIVDANGRSWEKADPYAYRHEVPPNTGSVVWDLVHKWRDTKWLNRRRKTDKYAIPLSIYEVHPGSWKKPMPEETSFYTYRELADLLVPYVLEMGFTHIELMPVMEHPYYLSWGYQVTGYYAATSRYGSPQDLMYLIDKFHAAGIGVILDWVPSHFPSDGHGPGYFDGTHLYEHPDPQKGYHPDWQSLIFNYSRNEVRSFLMSNAVFWCSEYHVDGIRVDAVASLLFLDYSRKEGEWQPNRFGGNENLEAISLIQEINTAIHEYFPSVMMIAEESTAYPFVTGEVSKGGLGFDFKWMMGWMNDTLKYFSMDPLFKAGAHNMVTFSLTYAYAEKFMLPFSHDEVVHGKASLINKMPGNESHRFAALRALYTYFFTHPGAKLLFMGGEFAHSWEWSPTTGLDWSFLKHPIHKKLQSFVGKLNQLYKELNALYFHNYDQSGFNWMIVDDSKNSVLVYKRMGKTADDELIVVLNLKPERHLIYGIPLDNALNYKILLQSSLRQWGGDQAKKKSIQIVEEEIAKPIDTNTGVVLHPVRKLNLNLEPYEALILGIEK